MLSIRKPNDLVSLRAATALAAAAVSSIGAVHQTAFAQTVSHVSRPAASKLADITKEPTLYVVTYSHLDTEWCWTYRQSILEYIPNTLHDNFALFDKYPNYVFNWTGANRYRFMKDYYPEDYARLKQYVAAGRWVPTGSAWDENDASIPAPESIIRSILYSNRFFKKEFGITSNQYMMPDTFGFPASLPTILAHSGLKGFSTKKLTYGAGSAVGVPFNVGQWIGVDGQSVFAALNPGDYRTRVTEDLTYSKPWLERLNDNGTKSGVYADYMYHGNGDEGGSPGAESASWLERSLAGTGPVQVRAGSADDLFTALDTLKNAHLPRYKGDLLLIQHSAGTSTSGAAMKRWNHRNELLADAAERAAVTANLLTLGTYPAERITQGWLRFLSGQMHDILPGTSIPTAYEFAWNDQVLALNQFADVTTQSVATVASGMDTRGAGIPIVVYNPLSMAREDTVEAQVTFPGKKAPQAVQVFGPNGKAVAAQIIGRTGNTLRIAFLARVPSVGFASFSVRPGNSKQASTVRVDRQGVENTRYRVRLDANGDVSSVYDKQAKRELLSAPARLAFLYEKPEKHPAWNMDWNDRQKPPVGYVDGPAKVTVLESGPVRVALQVERESRGSTFAQIIRLSAGASGNKVEFVTNTDWRTRESSLKAVFPLTVANPQATYNWEVGTILRGNNNPKKYETPSHRWFDLTMPDNRYGVSVLSEAKYGSDKPDDNTLRLTLLYTPGVRDNYQHQGTQDWGHHEIRYALQGHKGDWRAGGTQNQAARFNQPLAAFQTTVHPGALGRSFSLLKLSTSQVAVAALKKAEDSNEIIVRLYEENGKPVQNVRMTFASPIIRAREVDGQERPIAAAGKVQTANGSLVFDMQPYRPRAFALTVKPLALPVPKTTEVALALPFNTDVTSSAKGQHDGAFDTEGRTIPGEMLPSEIVTGGTRFTLGAGGGSASNAVVCEGQTLNLPKAAGTGPRYVYLLAAADGVDVTTTVQAGNRTVPLTIQNWGGYIGQWDTRLWKGKVPEKTFSWTNELEGIAPGYIKRDAVAWYSDHWRLASGENDPYRFCYLFRYAVPIPAGATTLTLPNDRRVRVLAATLSTRSAETRPAKALYDTYSE